jgi:hypothetical protein
LGEKTSQTRHARFHDLDALAGSWSNEETSAFNQALAKQRTIDLALWP